MMSDQWEMTLGRQFRATMHRALVQSIFNRKPLPVSEKGRSYSLCSSNLLIVSPSHSDSNLCFLVSPSTPLPVGHMARHQAPGNPLWESFQRWRGSLLDAS